MDADIVHKYLQSLGINNIIFRDQFFTINKKRVKDFCNLILQNNINIKWSCETRIDYIDNELVDIMKKAGLESICFGIESASQDFLDKSNRKKIDFGYAKNIVAYLKQQGVQTMAFYIIGIPSETWESAKKTFELSKYIESDIAKFSIYEPIDKIIDKEDITPDIFVPFQNLLNLDRSRKELTYKELGFLETYFHMAYNFKIRGFCKLKVCYLLMIITKATLVIMMLLQ